MPPASSLLPAWCSTTARRRHASETTSLRCPCGACGRIHDVASPKRSSFGVYVPGTRTRARWGMSDVLVVGQFDLRRILNARQKWSGARRRQSFDSASKAAEANCGNRKQESDRRSHFRHCASKRFTISSIDQAHHRTRERPSRAGFSLPFVAARRRTSSSASSVLRTVHGEGDAIDSSAPGPSSPSSITFPSRCRSLQSPRALTTIVATSAYPETAF